MSPATQATPLRRDFFASDTASCVLKCAIEQRDLALRASARGYDFGSRLVRAEMRYYAQIAVKIARRCRAARP
jgi:hypothetical protein